MRVSALLLVVLLAACSKSSPSAPQGHDPSVQVTNLTPRSVLLIWATDVSFDTLSVTAGTTVCQVWVQASDSVYFIVRDTLTVNGHDASTSSSPWLHVGDYAPFYTDTVFDNANGYTQRLTRMDAPCA